MSRERCERLLLTRAVEDGGIGFLRNEGIGPSFFSIYHEEARTLYKLQTVDGKIPTADRMEEKLPSIDWETIPDERDVPDYKRELREHHGQDIFLEKMMEAKTAWGNGDWESIPSKMAEWGQEIQKVLVPNSVIDLTENAEDRYEYFRERAEAEENDSWITSFAHPEMDEFIGGYQPGDLVTYVSRPAVGKTFSIILDAFHCWIRGAKVLFVSMETDLNQIGFRFDSLNSQEGDEAGFSTYNLRKGYAVKIPDIPPSEKKKYATDESADEYRDYIKQLQELRRKGECEPFYAINSKNASGRITPSYIESLARELGVDIVFVDYMGLIPADSGVAEERYRLEEVSWAFKEAAVRLDIPFVVPHQMNRDTEKAKEVNLSNFAGSDAVGRNVDIGIYITKEENVIKYQLMKARGGPTNRRFAWVWDYDTGIRRSVPYFSDEDDVTDVESGVQDYGTLIQSANAEPDFIWNSVSNLFGEEDDG